jgi:hypothetical protein
MSRCAIAFAILLGGCALAWSQERKQARVQATSDELVLALCYNHAAFDARYAQQRIVVSGVVSSIRRNPDQEGQYVLAMRSGTRDCTGDIFFAFNGQQQALAALQPPNQLVTVEATMAGNTFREEGGIAEVQIRFDDCTIVTAGPLSTDSSL